MSLDARALLEGWPFDPDQVSVRSVQGDDGREKIQLRVDLGLLQMEVEGRPDGERPGGHVSWLEFYEERAAGDEEFSLQPSDCAELMREGVQYYHRYLAFWRLDRYAECARDTSRNLRLFAFVRRYAKRQQDKLAFDRFRPYVTMMHTRAVATPLVAASLLDEALAAVDEGIAEIRRFLAEYGESSRAGECGELGFLVAWRRTIVQRRAESATDPRGAAMDTLKSRLTAAIREERYEEAAKLRDEIRQQETLTAVPPPPSATTQQM